MRTAPGATILRSLADVEAERQRRAASPAFGARVQALKAYQQARFGRTYADLFADPRYAPAARFFLEELYGTADFARRDADFARIVPALVRLFSHELVATVESLATLHALSEALDSRMAGHLAGHALDAQAYRQAWRDTGEPAARERQIALALQVGTALDRYTHSPMLRRTLKLMRGPARAAGLSALQAVLERGFEAFATMKGAEPFLAAIGARERALAAALFSTAPLPPSILGQLP